MSEYDLFNREPRQPREPLLADKSDLNSPPPLAGGAGGGVAWLQQAIQSNLKELSVNAWADARYAFLSELPLNGAIERFVNKVLLAAEPWLQKEGASSEAARRAAKIARCDRSDRDVEAVQRAAYKVLREEDKLMGILRFKPYEASTATGTYQAVKGNTISSTTNNRLYIALCAPSHCTIALLGPHFARRFGKEAWAIVDESRGLALFGKDGIWRLHSGVAWEGTTDESGKTSRSTEPDTYEALWKTYFKTICNQSRLNLKLQRQFLPVRYWKYLTEMEGS